MQTLIPLAEMCLNFTYLCFGSSMVVYPRCEHLGQKLALHFEFEIHKFVSDTEHVSHLKRILLLSLAFLDSLT